MCGETVPWIKHTHTPPPKTYYDNGKGKGTGKGTDLTSLRIQAGFEGLPFQEQNLSSWNKELVKTQYIWTTPVLSKYFTDTFPWIIYASYETK